MKNKTMIFIPGLPRCATTSVVNLLYQHPSIFNSRIKEPHFFLKNKAENLTFLQKNKKKQIDKAGFLLDFESYSKNYEDFKTSDFFLDASTLYSIHTSSIESIFEWLPPGWNAKFLVLDRDKFNRAVSHYNFSLEREEEYRDFEVAMDEEFNSTYDNWLLGGYLRGSNSDIVVSEILKYTEKSNIMVANIDDNKVFSQNFMQQVLTFLELDDFEFDFNVYNNTVVQIDNKILLKFRILLKKLRTVNPRLFDNPFTRSLFHSFIKIAKSKGSGADRGEFEHLREKYMSFYEELERNQWKK